MIHVLSLTWEGLDKLETLRPSLMKNLEATGQEFLWHIRDNGSKDGTVAKIKDWEHTKVHDIGHNRDNFAQGMNFLFQQAQPADEDIIFLLNNDMYFGEDQALNKMIACLSQPNVGLVGAKILYPNTNKLQHAGVCFIKKYNYMPYHINHGLEPTPLDETTREMQAVTAAICCFKAGDFKQLCTDNKSGRVGMNENFFWAFEDVDACLSMKYKLGKKVMYCASPVIFHEESAALKKNPVNKLMMPHNVNYFLKQWQGIYKKED